MSQRVTMELSDDLLAKLQVWGPIMANRLGRPVSVAETLSNLLEIGARHAGGAYRDDVPVGQISVRELANMIGVTDLEKARALARVELERAEKMRSEVDASFAHAGKLAALAYPTTVARDKLSAFFQQIANVFDSLPGCELVIAHAWYDTKTGEHVAPMTTPAPKGAS